MSEQRGDGSAARPLRLVSTGAPAPDLPSFGTPLVGRAAEIEHVRRALVDDEQRVVTLTGTGGVGKTRTAVEAAYRAWSDLPRRTLFVAARSATNSDELRRLIVRAAGWDLKDEATIGELVRGRLDSDVSLLIVDNGEQIEGLAQLVGELVAHCHELTVLITSRRALGLPGEQVVHLEPLGADDAVAMLVVAARRHDSRFEAGRAVAAGLAHLAQRLDGLPLALELAAGRLRVITPDEMIGLLDRRFELLRDTSGGTAQAGLWATIDWSYRLLDEPARQRFRALAVFPASFRLDAAASVAGCDRLEMLDTLGVLLDHHLVERADRGGGASRFFLLETIREFGWSELQAHGELDAARDAHAAWCGELVSGLIDELAGQLERWSEIDREAGHLDAALAWSVESGNAERVMEFSGQLWRYWSSRGRTRSYFRLLSSLLEPESAPSRARGLGLRAAGELALRVFDLPAAVDMFERAIAVFDALGDELSAAEARNSLAHARRDQTDFDGAEQLHQQALEVFRRHGAALYEASAMNGLAGIAHRRGDHVAAAAMWEHVVTLCEQLGDRRSQASVLANTAIAYYAMGDIERALAAHAGAIGLADAIGEPEAVLTGRLNRAEVLIGAGGYDAARADLEAATTLADQVEMRFAHVVIAHHRGLLADAEGDLGTAMRCHVDGLRGAIDLEHPFEALLFVERFAMLAGEVGERDIAAKAFAVANGQREAAGTPPDPEALHAIERFGLAADVAAQSPDETPADLVAVFERLALAHAGARRQAPQPDPLQALRDLGLSPREAEVAGLLAQHKSDREIADELFIGIRTVGSHVSAVLRKLGLASRKDVARRVQELG